MSSTSDLKTRRDILSETIRVATELRRSVEDRLPLPILRPPWNTEPEPIPECNFPIPHEIFAELFKLQVPTKIRDSILQLLYSRLVQRQQAYVSAYKRTCMDSSRVGFNSRQDFEAILRVNQTSAENYYRSMVKEVGSFIQAEVAKHEMADPEGKRVFNHEYTPFLAKYFEYNAYPSALHQSVLAEKSMMTRRQIEVWFQNHRNRAKKDDRVLRRNTSDLPLRVALTVLKQDLVGQANRSSSPSDQDSISDYTGEEEDAPQPTSCINDLGSFRPQHAFPSTYSSLEADPFTNDNGIIRFPPPTWARTPASSFPMTMQKKTSSTDLDDLARMFHMKLNILEGTKKYVSLDASKPHSPWFAATVTVPSQAPLPALVRAPSLPSSNISPSLSNISSFQFPAGSRFQTTNKAFLFSPQQEPARPRKISPLPRRIPVSSAVATPSSPNESVSRVSSFSSGYSPRSRSSSSSSCSRTPEPTTPPQLPTWDIPAIQNVGRVHKSPDNFDFSILFGNDPDVFSAMSFGSLSIPHSENLVADKQLSMSTSDFNSLMTFTAPSYIQARS